MLPYNDIKLALYKWAHYFRLQSGKRYELHELVNAAWCSNSLQNLTEIKFASLHIKNRMIDYMRKDRGFKGSYKNEGLRHQCRLFNPDTGELRHNPPVYDTPVLENKEVCRQLLQGLKPIEKEIVVKCVMLGQKQQDVAAEMGVTAPAISLRLKSIITKLRNRKDSNAQ